MRNVVLCAALVVCAAWPASAQVRNPRAFAPARAPRVFVGASVGIQPAAGAFADRFTFAADLESATVDVDYAFEQATIVDFGGAVRLWKQFGAGLAFSRYASDGASAAIEASIPHPFFFEQPRQVSGDETGLTRAERALHMQVVYIVPARGRLRVLLSAGPSRFSVEQDVVTAISYDESYPFDSATYRAATRRRVDASAIGFHAGADVAYMFSRSLGLGGMVRYAGASIDLGIAQGREVSVDAGGLQVGAGLRIAF